MLRSFSKKLFIFFTIAVVIAFALVCCTGILQPGKYWYIAVLGIGFPFIVLALIILFFFWLFFKSRWAVIPLLAIIAGWWQIHAMFGFHPFSSFSEHRPDSSLRIMQWNVSRLDQMNPKRPGGSYRQRILDYIQAINPDVLCMEEFFESNNPREFAQNIPYISNTLKYPYYFFARDHRRWDGAYEHGVVIFSRYPITDTLRIRYSGPDSLKSAESLIHADIDVNGHRIRVFATHLQSLRFDGNDYTIIRTIAKGQNNAMNRSMGVLKKFRQAYTLRSRQAELVRREMDQSPYPYLLCGDFNDVPNSYTYARIRADCHDAFLEQGFGIGRTFASLSPTLRIDYIFTSPGFDILQFRNKRLPYSDHFPLVTDLRLPPEKTQ